MNKKIGILTYQDAINYGAILQCYALYTFLTKISSYEIEIINYKSDVFKQSYTFQGILKNKRNSKQQKIRKILNLLLSAEKRRKFHSFKSNMQISEKYSKDNFHTINNRYDNFIIGSDQLWNYKINNNDDSYFLDVVDDKSKISTYATSIGLSKIDNNFKDKCNRYIKHYANIAVREETAKKIISKEINNNIEVVLDPVFLIDQKEWLSLCPKQTDNSILFYIFNKKYVEYAQSILADSNFDYCYINKISGNIKIGDFLNKKVKTSFNSGPIDFVAQINKAKLIFTDSFHCTAFSILLHKPFFVFVDNLIMETNSRMIDLLKTAGLESRIINKNTDLNDDIDWRAVDKKLSKEIQHSRAYLKRIIGKDTHEGQ